MQRHHLHHIAIALALAVLPVTSRAQSDEELMRSAYPDCFALYPDQSTAQHKACIELEARSAGTLKRAEIPSAVSEKLQELDRAKRAEESLKAQRQRSEQALKAQGEAAGADAVEFKGLLLGTPLSIIRDTGRFECQTSTTPIAEQICNLKLHEPETIADAPVKFLSLYFNGERLAGISIALDEEYFSQVTGALEAKYGKPATHTSIVRNRMGAEFENVAKTWRRGDATISARRYAGDLKTSSVMYQTDALLREFVRRKKASEKSRAGDL